MADSPEIPTGYAPKIGGNRRKPLRLRRLADLDARTAGARRAKALIAEMEADLGHDLTAGKRELVTRAALLGAYLADAEASWLAGQEVDTAAWFSAVDRQRRLLEVLGLERKARDVTSLSEYLATRGRQ
jgi:hypothetical protein